MSYLNNSRTRTPMDAQPVLTVRFKVVFPDFATFEDTLKAKNIDVSETDFVQRIFAYLQEMVGNTFMKYTTLDKNKGFTAWNWMKYISVYKRQKQFYDKALDAVNGDTLSGTSKLFKVNQTATGELEAKFLANGQTTDQTSQQNLLSRYETIASWANEIDPELTFISNMALAIVTPYQRENFGEIY